MAIGIGIGIPFGRSSGISWSSYWATRYISGLSVETISSTEQTITATIVGTGYDGVSFEYSTDLGINWSAGITDADGILNQTGLTAGTLYIWRARLYKGTNYGSYSDWDAGIAGYLMDKDGNIYTEVVIGTQSFLLQNLKTTKYNDGTTIPVLNNTNWALEDGTSGHDGSVAQVNNDAGNKAAYGLLYNWYAVNNAKGIAPIGCHITTHAELVELITFIAAAPDGIGHQVIAGKYLKEVGTTHWNSPHGPTLADNSSGMSIIGAGYRAGDGSYSLFKDYNLSWTATQFNSTDAYDLQIDRSATSTDQVNQAKKLGMSVRCTITQQIFSDNFIGNIIPTMTAIGEPTVLISDDGNQIDLWFTGAVGGVNNIYYSYSTDGLTFSVPVKTDIPDGYIRSGIMKVGSIYYHYANGNGDQTIHCFTGTDKIHFIDQGEMIGIGGVGVWDHFALGNIFAWKEDNNYYLFYDGHPGVGSYWATGLATASSPLGPWTKYGSNPIFADAGKDIEGAEIFRVNNEIIKHNGFYYAYMARGDGGFTGVFKETIRMRSSDLHTWVNEGLVRRVFHEVGGYISYADFAYCQFKGKSYVFMNPSNQVDAAYLDVGVDNRPLIAMLALTP